MSVDKQQNENILFDKVELDQGITLVEYKREKRLT
jgi:hypothetical protein